MPLVITNSTMNRAWAVLEASAAFSPETSIVANGGLFVFAEELIHLTLELAAHSDLPCERISSFYTSTILSQVFSEEMIERVLNVSEPDRDESAKREVFPSSTPKEEDADAVGTKLLKRLAQMLPRAFCGRHLNSVIGYRCQTCTTDKYAVICIDCFDELEHVGHEFKCFLSSGICDCGYEDAAGVISCCKKHVGTHNAPHPFCAVREEFGDGFSLTALANVTMVLLLSFLGIVICAPAKSDGSRNVSEYFRAQHVIMQTLFQLFKTHTIDSFWRVLALCLSADITPDLTTSVLLERSIVPPIEYRRGELLIQKMLHAQDRVRDISLYSLLEFHSITEVLLCLPLFLQLRKDWPVDRMTYVVLEEAYHSSKPSCDELLSFVVNNFIFEPYYRQYLHVMHQWYEPVSTLQVFRASLLRSNEMLTRETLLDNYVWHPLELFTSSSGFLNIWRSSLYSQVPTAYVGRVLARGPDNPYLLPEIRYKAHIERNIWQTAVAQLYSDYSPPDALRRILPAYVLALSAAAMRSLAFRVYVSPDRAQRLHRYCAELSVAGFAFGKDETARRLLNALMNGVIGGLIGPDPYILVWPPTDGLYKPVFDANRTTLSDVNYMSVLGNMVLNGNTIMSYAGKMMNFIENVYYEPVAALFFCHTFTMLSALDVVQVLRGKHIESDDIFYQGRLNFLNSTLSFINDFSYSSWFALVHGRTHSNDERQRKISNFYTLSELRAGFGRSAEERKADDDAILHFVMTILMHVITLNSSEAMSFEPIYAITDLKAEDYCPYADEYIDAESERQKDWDIVMYHPFYIPLHGLLAYSLDAGDTRRRMGISSRGAEDTLITALLELSKAQYYQEITPEERDLQRTHFATMKLRSSQRVLGKQTIFRNEACIGESSLRTTLILETLLVPVKHILVHILAHGGHLARTGVNTRMLLGVLAEQSRFAASSIRSTGRLIQIGVNALLAEGGVDDFLQLVWGLLEKYLHFSNEEDKNIACRVYLLHFLTSLSCFDYSFVTPENLMLTLYIGHFVSIQGGYSHSSLVDLFMRAPFWHIPVVENLLSQLCEQVPRATDIPEVYDPSCKKNLYRMTRGGWDASSIYSPIKTVDGYVDSWEQYNREVIWRAQEPSKEKVVAVPACIAGPMAMTSVPTEDLAPLVARHGNGLNPALARAIFLSSRCALEICNAVRTVIITTCQTNEPNRFLTSTDILSLMNSFYLLRYHALERSNAGEFIEPALIKEINKTYDALYDLIIREQERNSGLYILSPTILAFSQTYLYAGRFSPSPASATQTKTGVARPKLRFLKNKLPPPSGSLLLATKNRIDEAIVGLDISETTPADTRIIDLIKHLVLQHDASCHVCRVHDQDRQTVCQTVSILPSSVNNLYARFLKPRIPSDRKNIVEHPWLQATNQLYDETIAPTTLTFLQPDGPFDLTLQSFETFVNTMSITYAGFAGLVFDREAVKPFHNRLISATNLATYLYDIFSVRYFVRVRGCNHPSHFDCIPHGQLKSMTNACGLCRRVYNASIPLQTGYMEPSSVREFFGLDPKTLDDIQLIRTQTECVIKNLLDIQAQAEAVIYNVLQFHGLSPEANVMPYAVGLEVLEDDVLEPTPLPVPRLIQLYSQRTSLAPSEVVNILNMRFILFADVALYNVVVALQSMSFSLARGFDTREKGLLFLRNNLSNVSGVATLALTTLWFLNDEFRPYYSIIPDTLYQLIGIVPSKAEFLQNALLRIAKQLQKNHVTNAPKGLYACPGPADAKITWEKSAEPPVPEAQLVDPDISLLAIRVKYTGIAIQLLFRLMLVIGPASAIRYLQPDSSLRAIDLYQVVENPGLLLITMFIAAELGFASLTVPCLQLPPLSYLDLERVGQTSGDTLPTYGGFCQRLSSYKQSIALCPEALNLLISFTQRYNRTEYEGAVVCLIQNFVSPGAATPSRDQLSAIFTQLDNDFIQTFSNSPLKKTLHSSTPELQQQIDNLLHMQGYLPDPLLTPFLAYFYLAGTVLECITRFYYSPSVKTTIEAHLLSCFRRPSLELLLTHYDHASRNLHTAFQLPWTNVEAIKKYLGREGSACPSCHTPGDMEIANITVIVCLICGTCFCSCCGHNSTNPNVEPFISNEVDRLSSMYNALPVLSPFTTLRREQLGQHQTMLAILHHSASCMVPAVFYLPGSNILLCMNGNSMIWVVSAPFLSEYFEDDFGMQYGMYLTRDDDLLARLIHTVVVHDMTQLPINTTGYIRFIQFQARTLQG
ncbi:E3 ubiquitin-protein ligase [Giardia muris]|uniref:E3 ubiquitin-protein ligase n=1 Tax=Giardia muris TaxID=5742 RepID=A0A4Z1T654_GIAMU|nr:E3 ubiquitin-protein ligase [Giardia muris]|eukprot:TNJ28009.1 E3 ubiquitin-protein ligase [Giardia muris]